MSRIINKMCDKMSNIRNIFFFIESGEDLKTMQLILNN